MPGFRFNPALSALMLGAAALVSTPILSACQPRRSARLTLNALPKTCAGASPTMASSSASRLKSAWRISACRAWP